MKKRNVLLISGKKGAGKDTFASMFMCGFSGKSATVHFAAPMKELLASLLSIPVVRLEELKRDESEQLEWKDNGILLFLGNPIALNKGAYAETFIRLMPERRGEGDANIKSSISKLASLRPKNVREALQFIGTEVFKSLFGKTIWVEEAAKAVKRKFADSADCVLIPDFRFPEEYFGLCDLIDEDIYTIQIVRKMENGNGKASSHISENALEQAEFNYTWTIQNDGTLEDLERKAFVVAEKLSA